MHAPRHCVSRPAFYPLCSRWYVPRREFSWLRHSRLTLLYSPSATPASRYERSVAFQQNRRIPLSTARDFSRVGDVTLALTSEINNLGRWNFPRSLLSFLTSNFVPLHLVSSQQRSKVEEREIIYTAADHLECRFFESLRFKNRRAAEWW